MIHDYLEGQNLHDFLFNLYNYSDQIYSDQKVRLDPQDKPDGNKILFLFFIEWFFDKLGRIEIHRAISEAGNKPLNVESSEVASPLRPFSEAHGHLDVLRENISELLGDESIKKEVLKCLDEFYEDTKSWLNRSR